MNGAASWTLDARAGMLLHNSGTATSGARGEAVGASYAYDASGRLNQDFEGYGDTVTDNPGSNPAFAQWCPVDVLTPQNPSITCYSNGSRGKTYDAENRLRAETFTYQPYQTASGGPTYTTTSYGYAEYGAYWADTSGYSQPANIQAVDYGTDSHPRRFALYHPDLAGNPGANESRAWLWDGNDRLIECQLSAGQGLGDYNLASGAIVRINDRNRNGAVTMSRDAVGFSDWKDQRVRRGSNEAAPCSIDGGSPPTYLPRNICSAQHDGKLTADGWTLDYETWQGVRTSDLAIGQWNTPDAYAGEVHDPMSQKPFMWNGNNPYAYSDPSGYLIRWLGTEAEQSAAQNDYQDAIDFLKKNGDATASLLERLRDDQTFTVDVTVTRTGNTAFDEAVLGARGSLTLNWDSRGGLIPDDYDPSKSLTPAQLLVHEADHVLRAAYDPTGFRHDIGTTDRAYENAEEKRVIQHTEKFSTLKLGTGDRFDHGGVQCLATSVGGSCAH